MIFEFSFVKACKVLSTFYFLFFSGFSCQTAGLFLLGLVCSSQWSKDDGVRQAAVANQFIPMNTNPKDVLEMRNKVPRAIPVPLQRLL